MLTRLSRHAAAADSSRLLTDGRVQAPSAASLPDNLHSLSLRQLKDVCAAHGFTPKGKSTDAVIKELEARRFSGEDAVLLLE
ncbi:hypothetical protein T492DRAFT_883169 [Pavlovales sp. CCMP2436]|nr:hypothetical protein T492DRAFT_883169 [Pavlovales sp. CCMP2436]